MPTRAPLTFNAEWEQIFEFEQFMSTKKMCRVAPSSQRRLAFSVYIYICTMYIYTLLIWLVCQLHVTRRQERGRRKFFFYEKHKRTRLFAIELKCLTRLEERQHRLKTSGAQPRKANTHKDVKNGWRQIVWTASSSRATDAFICCHFDATSQLWMEQVSPKIIYVCMQETIESIYVVVKHGVYMQSIRRYHAATTFMHSVDCRATHTTTIHDGTSFDYNLIFFPSTIVLEHACRIHPKAIKSSPIYEKRVLVFSFFILREHQKSTLHCVIFHPEYSACMRNQYIPI